MTCPQAGSSTDAGAVRDGARLLETAHLAPLAPVVVVCGHYGTGKTNFALNLAFDAAAAGNTVTLADLDVVNPYFRSSDYMRDLEAAGIEVISPVLAGTALDTPSVSGRVDAAIDRAYAEAPNRVLIIDAGGDDVGATALGRFAPRVSSGPYAMLYVVNRYRNLTQHASEAIDVLREIEHASGLSATGVVNNSHLKQATDAHVVDEARAFGEEVARLANVPLICATAPFSVSAPIENADKPDQAVYGMYPVNVYVKTPWE